MIIGISGLAGSGKSAVGEYIASKFGFAKIAFADKVKDATAAIFGWERALLEGDTKESRDFREEVDPWWTKKFGYDVTPRLMLQYMGTEAGRNVFHRDMWVICLDNEVRKRPDKNFVVTDLRFPNELNYFRYVPDGYSIEVIRPPKPVWYRDAEIINTGRTGHAATEPPVHLSEWAIIGLPHDYTILNNGTLEELHARADAIVAFLLGKK